MKRIKRIGTGYTGKMLIDKVQELFDNFGTLDRLQRIKESINMMVDDWNNSYEIIEEEKKIEPIKSMAGNNTEAVLIYKINELVDAVNKLKRQ